MAFDGLKPAVTDGKVSILSNIRGNFLRLATLFQGGAGGDSNIPIDAKRIDNDGKVYKWDGLDWIYIGTIGAAVTLDYQFGAYVNNAAGGAATTFQSSLVGTRINVSSGSYAASTFNFAFSADFGSWSTDQLNSYTYQIRGFIKKLAGGNPTFVGTIFSGAAGGSHNAGAIWFNGAMAGSGDTASGSSASLGGLTAFNVERVHSSDELCFRINATGLNIAWASRLVISGPRNYAGTLITSANGILF